MSLKKYLWLLTAALTVGWTAMPVFPDATGASTAAQAQSSASGAGGSWSGPWAAPDGYLYLAQMQLTVDSANNVTGSIHWTLKVSPRKSEKSKIGLAGTEYVQGTFYPDSNALDLEGIRLDDPHHVLGTDVYRLRLSDTGNAMGGLTSNHGRWDATFILVRQPGELQEDR